MVRRFADLLVALLAVSTMFNLFSFAGEPMSVAKGGFCVSNYDFMYISEGKFNFYRVSDGAKMLYKGEKGKIMNYCFVPNSRLLYYCVIDKNKVLLKSVDFGTTNPCPVMVADLGLKVEDCVSETYGEYGALLVNNDGSAVGILHDFSWDVYGFEKVKIYYPNTGKLEDSDDRSIFFEGTSAISYGDFEYRQDEDTDIESLKLYYVKDGADVCLSCNIDFPSMKSFEMERVEIETYQYSHDGKYVLYGAILEWGDYPHGPYCIASIDGKYQLALDDTDISQTPAIGWLNNGALIYVGTEILSTDAGRNSTKTCIKIVNPGKDVKPDVLVHGAVDFLIVNAKN